MRDNEIDESATVSDARNNTLNTGRYHGSDVEQHGATPPNYQSVYLEESGTSSLDALNHGHGAAPEKGLRSSNLHGPPHKAYSYHDDTLTKQAGSMPRKKPRAFFCRITLPVSSTATRSRSINLLLCIAKAKLSPLRGLIGRVEPLN